MRKCEYFFILTVVPILFWLNFIFESSGNDEYVVKAMEVEQQLVDVDLNACTVAGLSVDSINLTLPTIADVGSVTIAPSDRPDEDDAPTRVVGGEIE